MKCTIFLLGFILVSTSAQACFWGPCKGEIRTESSNYAKDFPDFEYYNQSIEGHIHELKLISKKNGDVVNLMPFGHLFYYQSGFNYIYERDSFFAEKGCYFDLKGWGRTDRGEYERYDYDMEGVNLCRLNRLEFF